jgi:hypothetical protein
LLVRKGSPALVALSIRRGLATKVSALDCFESSSTA